MKFLKTKLNDAYVIDIEKKIDSRGFFARSWDKEIFRQNGIDQEIVQSNISFNKKKGTLRGLHYQDNPFEEEKLVRCTKGKVYEVFLDLRPNSKTFKQWDSVELSEENYKMLFVPKGFALGFQTLEDDSELFYQMFQKYVPKYGKGIRWNDPFFDIKWPLKITVISEKDKSWEFVKI